MAIVVKAMASSSVHIKKLYQGAWSGTPPAPKVERPRARLKSWSICASAAVVAGEVVGADSVIEVEVEGNGRGMWVAINMW